MISNAYIHEYGNGKMEPEHKDIQSVLESRGVKCQLFTTKRLHRNQLLLDQNTLVVGDHPTMQSVFKRIGFNDHFSSYPESLKPFLKRTIRETSIGALLTEKNTTEIANIFIKPKTKAKLFTGFVVRSNNDLIQLYNYARNTQLHVSSVVEWIAEFRVFICNSKIVGIRHYDGGPHLILDMVEVQKAVEIFENSNQRTTGYSLDFGLLKNGETALVEWNDGYALGSYDLEKEVYTDLILARWNEIIGVSSL